MLVVLAYLPALTAAPGRMPADSKLYLYLDPQRLMADGLFAFDPRQFGGWVPHQHIAYLWPSGPWFAVFDLIGVPDWIAHRLWIGTIILLAGLGVRWVAGLLGLPPVPAFVAGLVYMLSPYLLPYVSRTSVMLLPWAGLGWIVGLTILAATVSRWKHAALLALVVFTVGSVNATALAMIIPAPVLWLVQAVASGRIAWRTAVATAARIAVACTAVSLWWIAALVIQGRYGADVLAYSETLESVSFTSIAPEIMRHLGYWLFYIRDPAGATTSASLDYLTSAPLIALGFGLTITGCLGLLLVSWGARRYAALLIGVGLVLAVGVHPIDDRSPLMRLLVGDTRAGLALALRSSTRALPVLVLGLALGTAALVGVVTPTRRRRAAMAVIAIVLVLANLPAAWSGGYVDPSLERDQDVPDGWTAAATELDALPAGYRVLQIPGAEFGAFRWGYTVDQPLPGLTERAVITRDLLPLGSPPMMDLVYALDDRIQDGVLEGPSLAPIARLLAADTIWLAHDNAYERFRTPRPDRIAAVVDAAPDIGPGRAFGPERLDLPPLAMIDERSYVDGYPGPPRPSVELFAIERPRPVVRSGSATVLVAGSGDGLVDAAAAGLLDTEAVIVTAATTPGLAEAASAADLVIVTDTNRRRARHWRSSQDVVGETETASTPATVRVPGDQRLPIDDDDPAHQTVAVHRGPVIATASGYGEPFAYRPEVRPHRAVDGDPSTAWRVGDRHDPVGETIALQVDTAVGVEAITVRQAATDSAARRISRVRIETDDREPFSVDLDGSSIDGGQRIDLAGWRGPGTIRLTITAVTAPESGRADAVGFAEIDLGLGPTTEVLEIPGAALAATPADTPLAIVMTRHRIDPADRWRTDPEPTIERTFALPERRTFALETTVRLDARATDSVLAGLLAGAPDGVPAVASERLTGIAAAAGWAAVDGDPETWWISPMDPSPGLVLDIAGPIGPTVTVRQPGDGLHSRITRVRVADGTTTRPEVDLGPDETRLDTAGLDGDRLRIEITGIDESTTIDRRYGDEMVLPVALQVVDGVDPIPLPPTFDTGCRDDLVVVDGIGVPIRVTGTVAAALAGEPLTTTSCGPDLVLDAGRHEIGTVDAGGLDVDRIVLRSGRPPAAPPPPAISGLESSRTAHRFELGPCPTGCWVVLGEGVSPGWEARVDGRVVAGPRPVDGGSSGWWLEAADTPRSIEIVWRPQRSLTIALIASAIAVLGCAVIALRARRAAVVPDPAPRRIGSFERDRRRRTIVGYALWAVTAALVIAPAWGLVAAVIGAVTWALGRPRLLGMFGVVALAGIGALVATRVLRFSPLPDAGWVTWFTDLHRPTLLAVTAVVCALLVAADPPPTATIGPNDSPGPSG